MPVRTTFAGHDGDQPSRRAWILATVIVGGLSMYGARRLGHGARTAIRLGGAAAIMPLALWLTRQGF